MTSTSTASSSLNQNKSAGPYSAEIPDLLIRHFDELVTGSGFSVDVVKERGYCSVLGRKKLTDLGFGTNQRRPPGLLLPVWAPDGSNGLYQFKPDKPRSKPNGDLVKYETPTGAGLRLDVPPRCRPMLADPSIPILFTEGIKKADAAADRGMCSVSILGVWGFLTKNSFGAVTLSVDFRCIALKGRQAYIAYDSDVTTKSQVKKALDELREVLSRKGAKTSIIYLPPGPGGAKCGVDDYLLGHTVDELLTLAQGPAPAPKAAAPSVELLDAAPLEIRRPLALLDGTAYAATWLYCRTTRTESVNSKGEVITHNPPLVTTEKRLFIVRDDGTTFGEGGDAPMADLGVDVILPEIPPPDKLWTTKAVNACRRGERPDASDVFRRVADVVDCFIDFDRSLADQRTMAELVASYIMGTYFLNAFQVFGNLWANGDRGCGKTQLEHIVTQMGYLGLVILSGGSYASLRDMADYGACLAFDDAENLSDPKRTDPDKRTLLLSGNRVGSVVSLKEPTSDGTWRTRYVNCFCPRLFSAIEAPDPVLASRSIVVPLIRTNNRDKANADPLDYSKWPHDRAKLQDDLWALGLANLAKMSAYEAQAVADAEIDGRNLEPWRAVLAVAKWLERGGVTGLFDRLSALCVSYQKERPDLEKPDLTILLVKTLVSLFESNQPWNALVALDAWNACIGDSPLSRREGAWRPSELLAELHTIGESDDIPTDAFTAWHIGIAMGRMRFKATKEKTKKRRRYWIVTLTEVERWATTYGIEIPTW